MTLEVWQDPDGFFVPIEDGVERDRRIAELDRQYEERWAEEMGALPKGEVFLSPKTVQVLTDWYNERARALYGRDPVFAKEMDVATGWNRKRRKAEKAEEEDGS